MDQDDVAGADAKLGQGALDVSRRERLERLLSLALPRPIPLL
jgi:hypothetical protein